MKTQLIRGSWLKVVACAMALTSFSLWAQQPAPTPLQKAEAAAQAASAEKAAADKVVAEKTAIVEKTNAAKATVDQLVVVSKDAAQKATDAAAVVQGEAAVAAAKDSVAKITAAAQAAEQAAAAAKVTVDAAVADQAAAQKTAGEKTAAADRASQSVLAEKAYAAMLAVRQSNAGKATADQALAQEVAAFNKGTADHAAAAQVVATVTAAKAAADQVLAEKAAATKAAVDAVAAEQDAAKKPPLQENANKLEAERVAAEKAAADQAVALKTETDKATAAKAALDAVTAKKTAAEQAVTAAAAAIVAAKDTSTVAEADAVGGLKPITSAQWDYAKARHLLFRAGFGGSAAEVEKLRAMGLQDAVAYLVDYHKQPLPNILFDVRPLERPLGYEQYLDGTERTDLSNERTNRERVQHGPLRAWWLKRMAETPRPLEEKLVLFWHDHFATGYEDKLYNSHMLYRQNQLLREYADQYDGLMRGIIKDTAMIIYLDNQVNVKGSGNENLGREVLELFSLGRDQGYTEADLRELSRALTGYNYVPHLDTFRFNGTQHDETPKTILGQTGNYSGDEAIDIILQHPSTGRYIAKKLFEFFAHRQPSDDVVNRLAHVVRSNNYDLAPMLTNLFQSEEFYSERSLAQNVKSPVELMVNTVRILQIPNVNYGVIDNECNAMGQLLFQPPNVAGWEEGRFWMSANWIMIRYNGVANLVEQGGVDLVAILEGKAGNAAEIVDFLSRSCLLTNVSDAQRQELITFLGEMPPAAEWAKQRDPLNARLRALVVLLMSTPEYQVS